jgi:histidinol-phosphatase (PHP family)
MAFLTDYHFHTNISRDSQAPYYDMVMAEYNAGVRNLCVTDHCDTVDWRTMDYYPACKEVAAREKAAYEANIDRFPKDLNLRMGMELAEVHFHPELLEELTNAPWLDFILGSYHITRQFGDFHDMDYHDPAYCRTLWDIYLTDLQTIAELNYFDVMAHIGYFRRYAHLQGVDVALTLAQYGDRVEHLLKTLIHNGRGIEINCSGIRDGCGPFPSEEILRLYRSLGGEIITIGSDAHRPEDAAKCVDVGQEILKACGFRYITTFTKHKPEFISI